MGETKPFEPHYMKIGILTAALQELTPRDVRDGDPDRAIEDWIEYANEIGVDSIQLSAALHPSVADIPEEAMLDPVANTLDLRAPFDSKRAERVQRALAAADIEISDIGYFDNMLIADPELRRQKHDFMYRAMDAAVELCLESVTGFVGRNIELDMDENLNFFREQFVPLLRGAKDRGLVYRVENCPMPGWNTTDLWINNIGYTPGAWMKLADIADKEGVGDQFRITYDDSHSILQGQNARDVFEVLKSEGYGDLIDSFHGKGNVIGPGLDEWGYQGMTVGKGDREDGKPVNPGNAWKVQTAVADHELPGTARYDTLAYVKGKSTDWFDHQYAAREILGLGEGTTFVVEHEYGPARDPRDREGLLPLLKGSVSFMRNIDKAAADQYALHQVMESKGLEVQRVHHDHS